MIEAVKFLATGLSNTAVDFIVLNILIVIFGIGSGDPKFILFKAISYLVASVNSFVLNKWWVFKDMRSPRGKQVGSFAVINIAGLVINTVVSLVVFQIGTVLLPDISPHLWANIGALFGTGIVLIFNYLSYKFIIFNK